MTIDGHDYYLGPYGTKASKAEHDRLVFLWLANGRRMPAPENDVTIVEMLASFRRHAVQHYRKNGRRTRSLDKIDDAGCRPGELCIIRPVDADRSGDVWVYSPGAATGLAQQQKKPHRRGRNLYGRGFRGGAPIAG